MIMVYEGTYQDGLRKPIKNWQNCIECTDESVCLLYKIKNTTFIGLADNLQEYTYKITNILCFF
jgi:hypothetical protein